MKCFRQARILRLACLLAHESRGQSGIQVVYVCGSLYLTWDSGSRDDVGGMETAFSRECRDTIIDKGPGGPPVLQATGADLGPGVQLDAGLMASRTCDATSGTRRALKASVRGGKMM
jgi:hypothetical protein